MVNLAEFKGQLVKELEDFEDARFEVQCILCEACSLDKTSLLLKKEIDKKSADMCLELVKKRKKGIPLQYLFGNWEFYGMKFSVGEGVLIPRADTEILVDVALKKILQENMKIVDLCAGSGCVSIAIDKNAKNCEVIAIEKSKQASDFLLKNIEDNKARAEVVMGDVLEKQTALKIKDIDIIVCNPPYLTESDMQNLQKEVRLEPSIALYGGEDGLDFYKKIPLIWFESLKPCGYLIFEIGSTQANDVKKILQSFKFKEIEIFKDASGLDRVVCARKT